MKKNAVFKRKFSLSDLIYAATGYRRQHQHQLVSQLVVEGTGSIAEAHLQNAISKVTASTPACRVRLRGVWGFKYWCADGKPPAVRTLQQEWNGCHDAKLNFIDTPLDLLQGPVAEVVQVVGSKTFLVFRVHHAVMDGVGLVDFVKSVFCALRDEPMENYHSTITVEKLPPGNIAAIPKSINDAAIPFALRHNDTDTIDRARIWQRIPLEGKDSRILLRTILALAHVTRNVDDSTDEVRLHIPVSLRRHLPDEKSSANLIGMLRLDIDKNDSIRSLVKKMGQQLDQQQELPIAANSLSSMLTFWIPLKLVRALEKRYFNAFFRQPKFRCSGIVTSLGNIDLEDCHQGDFIAKSAFCIPVSPLGSPVIVSILSNEQGGELVLSASLALISESEMDSLAQRLHHCLQSAK